MNRLDSFGYFDGMRFVSRGPWFKELFIEDDGLDWFYTFLDSDSKKCYLLSNNLPVKDREILNHLYFTQRRNNYMSWTLGLWLSMETLINSKYSRGSARGW